MTDPLRSTRRPRPDAVAAGLFAVAALAALGFVVTYLLGADTQLLGATLALALGAVAVALVLIANRVLPRRTVTEQRPRLADPDAERELGASLREGVGQISRRRMLAGAAGAAGTALGGAVALPMASLGPAVGDTIYDTPWRRGRRVVDERGQTLAPAEIAIGTFLTAFPEGADPRELGSPIVVLRVELTDLHLPPERAGWAPQGVMAFSKVCTHAGCAIGLFRHPTYEPTSVVPALVCPCHYSTFDVGRAGKVIFGPAGRPLPQLPLTVGADGKLAAGGPFSGPIGPAWWGVGRS